MTILNLLPVGDNDITEVVMNPQVYVELLKMGIELVGFDNHFEPDYIFILSKYCTKETLDSIPCPVILFDKIDGTGLTSKCYELINHPKVHKVAKSYRLDSCDKYNVPFKDNRYFTKFLSSDTQEHVRLLAQSEYDKLADGITFGMYNKMAKVREIINSQGIEGDRPIDVFFAGTTQYSDNNHWSGRLITDHRVKCAQKILEYGITCDRNVEVHQDRAFSYEGYIGKMLQSKIVVSPWGFGEACHRDYEAIMCGCTVIKPQTDFMLSAYSIFNVGHMNFCRADWSDLVSVIEGTMRNMDFYRDTSCLNARLSQEVYNNSMPEAIAKTIGGLVQ